MSINRVCIKATLTLNSPMHIGTGEREDKKDKDDKQLGSVALVALDHSDNPCIPGSALKGIMRDALAPLFRGGSDKQKGDKQKNAFKAVFGMPPDEIESTAPDETESTAPDKKQSIGGKAVFQDAIFVGDAPDLGGLPEEVATAHNPVTGAAKSRTLRATKTVPAGTAFAIKVMLDNADDSEIAVVKKGLEVLGASPTANLGGGSRSGHGQFDISSIQVERADANAIADWLADGSGHWSAHDLIFARQNANTDPAGISAMATSADDSIFAIVKLHFAGQMLSRGETVKKDDVDTTQPYKQGQHYVLTGRSVLGVLRARARRICLTLGKGIKNENSPFRQLFGNTGYDGAFSAGNFVCAEAKIAAHEMVAIDRFTGGAKDQDKFRNEVLEKPAFSGKLSLRFGGRANNDFSGKKSKQERDKLAPAAVGLLALVLRDLAEGDLTFGSGSSKGYGAIEQVELTELSGGVGVYDETFDQELKTALSNPSTKMLAKEKVRKGINAAVQAFVDCTAAQDEETQADAATG